MTPADRLETEADLARALRWDDQLSFRTRPPADAAHAAQMDASQRVNREWIDRLRGELGEVSEGSAEGGAVEAQRCDGTGWRHVAEASEAETDSGLITGGRTVVGDPSLTSPELGELPTNTNAPTRTDLDGPCASRG